MELKDTVFINDKVVKKILNSERKECREYLIRIISEVTGLNPIALKESIELVTPEVGSNIHSVNNETDVIYKTDDNYINIEINYNNKKIVEIKNNVYMYSLIMRQIKNSKDYKKVLPIIQININNYDKFKFGEFVNESVMMEVNHHVKRDEMIRIFDINLEYLRKIEYNRIIERNNNLAKILYIFICKDKEKLDYIYNGDEVMEKVREGFDSITSAIDSLLYYNREELEEVADEYERELARKEGREEGIKEGLEQGLEQGIEQGLEQGREEVIKNRNIDFVKNMYENNFCIEDIVKCTKLSIEEVKEIIK